MTDRPLFVFGSMLDEDVLAVVLDRPFESEQRRPAVLDGFRRLRLPDESYPILVPAEGGAVHGQLLMDLSAADRARITFYESDEYALTKCRVRLAEENALVDACYHAEGTVMPGAHVPWELSWWQRHHKQRYLPVVERYMALFGTADIQEAERLWSRLAAEWVAK